MELSAPQRLSTPRTSLQLGVNNDSFEVLLYCFWPKAFCRNNFVTCCQGSFCPQPRQKNKEQRWEDLYLIPVSPKHPGRAAGVACLEGVGWGQVMSHPICARLPLLLLPFWSLFWSSEHPAHSHHRAFAVPFSFA